MCVIGLTANFWHSIYGVSDKEGLFGYAYMSSFLYAIGNIIFPLSISLILNFASKQINNGYENFFKYVSYVGIFICCFFLIAVLLPKKQLYAMFGVNDFHPFIYYAVMIILSVSSGMLLKFFHEGVLKTEEVFKQKITTLFRYIFSIREDIKPEAQIKHRNKRVELVNEIIPHEQES